MRQSDVAPHVLYSAAMCSCLFTSWGATSRALENYADFGGSSSPMEVPWIDVRMRHYAIYGDFP